MYKELNEHMRKCSYLISYFLSIVGNKKLTYKYVVCKKEKRVNQKVYCLFYEKKILQIYYLSCKEIMKRVKSPKRKWPITIYLFPGIMRAQRKKLRVI